MANRNNDMRSAMTNEDSRIRNILAQTQGVEGNYFNQSNTMANNILQRLMSNQGAQNQANQANTQARNQWANGLISAGGSLAGAVLGYALAPSAASQLDQVFGGMADPMQMASAGGML